MVVFESERCQVSVEGEGADACLSLRGIPSPEDLERAEQALREALDPEMAENAVRVLRLLDLAARFRGVL